VSLAAGERLFQPRQRSERARHADVLASGAGSRPTRPDSQWAQSRGGRVEMRGEFGDLVTEGPAGPYPCNVFITSAFPVSSAGRPAKMISPRSMA
jgi:hypothetical protein